MKIGILSMHRVANYGSFWQAYCLKEMIKLQEECDIEFIDIIPGDVESRTEYKRSFGFEKIKRIPYYLFQKKKNNMFVSFQNSFFKCSNERNYSSDYDIIIIGSDEVFNFVQHSPWGFSEQLYGNIDNDNVNSYAACFGSTTIEDIFREKRDKKISEGLQKMRNLSVRDLNSANIVKKLIDKEVDIHLDPVVVGDLPKELPSINKERYILVYSYDFRMSEQKLIDEVRLFAREQGLKIFSVGFYQSWVDKNILPNPMELLAYFKNAEYVVTDTFHGTIFSIRMHRKFVTVVRESNKQKLEDLLCRVGMEERRYIIGNPIKDTLLKDIDYNRFESLRDDERNRTNLYLKKCLKQ